jgi:hypothetical protein
VVEIKDGLTDKKHLLETIEKNSSLKISAQSVVDNHLEKSLEIYRDGVFVGYALIFNFLGKRSLHGYKFIKGHALGAFKIAKKIIEDFKVEYISTTADHLEVARLARLLGFTKERQVRNVICFEKG